ncbi:MAG: prephenate dehydratase [archaeon]|nr:prephenate dehydratase [archaeon]
MVLEKQRKEIDEVDEKILELLGKRIGLAKEIGQEKKQENISIYDPVREQEVLEKLHKKNKGTMEMKDLEGIFKEIFSASRKAQGNLKIAFLGPETTFTHAAALVHFGSAPEYLSKDSIKEVFRAVEKSEAEFGVVPIENSLEGSVTRTYDMFLDSNLKIVAEIAQEINHNLISKHRLKDVKKLYTHPMAFSQCKNWIAKNLPKAEIIEVSSTAKGAESAGVYINSAGIGTKLAAKKYGLQVLAENIQDQAGNYTRFLVIGKTSPKKAEKSKTSIVFSVKHESGALFNALEALKNDKINMTKIESRPTRNKNWEYVFFVDFEGHEEDENVQKVFRDMGKNVSFLKVLGSYPQKARYE